MIANFGKDIPIHYLKPAGFFFLKKTGVIRTVLGSCVTITMFSRQKSIGAVCHPVLPECRKKNKVCYFEACREKYKYVECVIPEMVRRFKQENIDPDELEVKMFGGSELINNTISSSQFVKVGLMNVEMALNVLYGFNIPLKSSDTGGKLGRRLFFNTSNGDVWIKKLTSNRVDPVEVQTIHQELSMQKQGLR